MEKNNNLNEDSLSNENVKFLIEALMEDMKRQSENIEEPVELYAHKIHSKLFTKPENLSDRLSSGYHSLLKEIADENK